MSHLPNTSRTARARRRSPFLIAGIAAVVVATAAGCGSSDDSDQSAAQDTTAAAATTKPADDVTGENAEAVCVRNGGDREGISQKAADKLEKAGFKITDVANLHTSAIVDDTVMYAPNQEAKAKDVAKALGGKTDVVPRPRSFNPCDGAIVVVLF
ncbi:MAG: LytR C-terminal domain-containing protein [Gordonia sp. (in: high G+C Gram-positive bacteria)]|uniref:LytR C-terminal domain-containing protein n=1 Tax=Gordonia sp. (in: high G+C Gram-positive bacteria) TaxID=84139 RepID=UPI0039E49026